MRAGMGAFLLLISLASIGFSACITGEVAGVRCDLNGTLYYKECVSGGFVARERSCFGEGKACSVEAADCVPAANCTADAREKCADEREVVTAKCNMRMMIQYQSVTYRGVAQPTGESCAGCAPGYPCEGPAENLSAVVGNFSVSVSLRELDASGNPSRYFLQTLRPGENASLRDLGVRLISAGASVSCTREGDVVVGNETALLEVSWGPAKANVSLGEGEKSIRYCATYFSSPPCADIDLDVMIPVGGIREDAACVALAQPEVPTTPANVTPPAPAPPDITQPAAAQPNITPPVMPAPAAPQNVTPSPQEPVVPFRCLGIFLVLSLLVYVVGGSVENPAGSGAPGAAAHSGDCVRRSRLAAPLPTISTEPRRG